MTKNINFKSLPVVLLSNIWVLILLRISDLGLRVFSASSHISNARELIDAFLELIKIRITFFVGMSAIFGCVLATDVMSIKMVMACVGIFLLSCASAAMNHYQERKTDALMHRTMNRPLPSGLLQPQSVLLVIAILSILGSIFIVWFGNLIALLLSWLAFISYNIVYTPLKRVTPFAVIPGSFVGALPVMAGWAVVNESTMSDPKILIMASFFFIWQVPHFWLLMNIYSADYERGGFPTLRKYFKEKTSAFLIFLWIVLLAILSFFFLTARIVNNLVVQLVIIGLGVWLIASVYSIISRSSDKRTERYAFMKINVYVLAVTLIVMIDKLLAII